MDAVILVNDFDQHAPAAIRALEQGLSVLSETAARTLAEGVALVEAAERSAGIYMFAENYPYMPFTQEMWRRYAAGDIGEVRYAEAEYLDEPADLAGLVNDLGPLAGPHPRHLLLHPLPGPGRLHHRDPASAGQRFRGTHCQRPGGAGTGPPGPGWAALLALRLDNGAVFTSLHGFLEAGQQSWVRIHGDRGLMENLRLGDTRTLRVVWDVKDGEELRRAEKVFLAGPLTETRSTSRIDGADAAWLGGGSTPRGRPGLARRSVVG